jgi:hypothetical protein
MKLKIILTISFLLLLIFILSIKNLFAESYYNNFGIEFETGMQEKSDTLLETLDDYYTYYKNNIFTKILNDEKNEEFSIKLENGTKDYLDNNLDNHFHLATLGYNKILSEIFALDISAKGGVVIAEEDEGNSYGLKKIEPKLIAKINNFEVSSSIAYQYKDYKSKNTIQDASLNFGIKKQFSQSSSGILKFGIKNIEQAVDDVKSKKNSQYAKIGYYWQR